jgi:hypothetical protein
MTSPVLQVNNTSTFAYNQMIDFGDQVPQGGFPILDLLKGNIPNGRTLKKNASGHHLWDQRHIYM